MGIYDNILNGTFASLGVPQQPTTQPGMMGRGLPTDRLAPGAAGLPNPSPGSGLTPQQLAAMGGMTVDNRTRALGYVPPTPTTPAVNAATTAATGGVPMPTQPNVNAVSGTMKPSGIGGGLLGLLTGGLGGGLMEQITGPSKNGMGGLAGLLGGPEQDGLLQMLFGGGGSSSSSPSTSPAYFTDSSNARMPATTINGAPVRINDTGGGPSTGTVASHESNDIRRARLMANAQPFRRQE